MMMRDYVCAPLCEEFCFRACVLATVRGAGASAASAASASALVFAGAHARHYVGMRARGASTSRAFRACRAQMTFTAVFGAMACRVFSRTESLRRRRRRVTRRVISSVRPRRRLFETLAASPRTS